LPEVLGIREGVSFSAELVKDKNKLEVWNIIQYYFTFTIKNLPPTAHFL
jgi:hypothetical protein